MEHYKINDIEFKSNKNNIFDFNGNGRTRLFIISSGGSAKMFHKLFDDINPIKIEVNEIIYFAFISELKTNYNECDETFDIDVILKTVKEINK